MDYLANENLTSAISFFSRFQAPMKDIPSKVAVVDVKNGNRSAAYIWLDIALEATAREHSRNRPRSTIGSRILAIATNAMYDAWAAYDRRAIGTQLGNKLRRPIKEHTVANKAKAIAYATFRALLFVLPDDQDWVNMQMRNYGLDPNDISTDLSTPQGIGNEAAAAVIQVRRRDGANQLGDHVGSDGMPYSDYTFYRSINTATQINDPDHWQPIVFEDSTARNLTPGFITPHWYLVKPFALERSDQFRPGPQPKVNSTKLRMEIDEVISYNANLSLTQKAIVEYNRDGPNSTGQAGHWLRIAQMVSERDQFDVDRDVKIFFSVAMAAFDAFIAAWETKRFYDSSRPWTLVRHYYAGRMIRGWGGPGKGTIELRAEDWHPYSPFSFKTPPFPGYLSGHSAVSAACAKILERFTGSDYFGGTETRMVGTLTEPGFDCQTIQMYDGQSTIDSNHSCIVTLPLATFSGAAELAGISRIMGGYHIQTDNIEGLKMGRSVADIVWPHLQHFFNQTQTNRAPSFKTISSFASSVFPWSMVLWSINQFF